MMMMTLFALGVSRRVFGFVGVFFVRASASLVWGICERDVSLNMK